MTSTLRKLSNVTLAMALAFSALVAQAQSTDSLTLSVTPTLFQMSALPGQVWESQIKVINSNSFPITVYAEPVNLLPSGESGHSKFIPIFADVTEGTTLAEWIEHDKNLPYTIPAYESAIVPVMIRVPENAPPGGHFAAMLVGTKPPDDGNKLTVKTSQLVSSLFFLRIEGDVDENGHIRTFSVIDRIVDRPRADFELRFENRGNVHLQPQGQIKIYNMWGKERGVIPINAQTHFGNVLPQSIRKFEFSWSGETSLTDIGRYKAEVGLAYGLEAKKYETSELYFWVIPLKPLLIGLFFIGTFITLIFLMVRAYVRRMLVLAGLDPNHTNLATADRGRRSKIVYEGDVALSTYQNISAPVRFGVRDLRARFEKVTALVEGFKVTGSFVLTYKLFFLSVIALVVASVAIVWFFKQVMVEQRDYEISIANPNEAVALNGEEVLLQDLRAKHGTKESGVASSTFTITLVNTSNQPGVAATTAHTLEKAGYAIKGVSSATDRRDRRTVIVYPPGLEESALALSRLLNGALLSAATNEQGESEPTITIYAGEDLVTTE